MAPPCKRAGKRGGRRRRRHKRVRQRAAHCPHGIGAAVLFVVGVQDEKDVESARQGGIRLVLGLDHLPQHVHEILGVAEVVVGINIRETEAVAIRVGGDGGHLSNQAIDLKLAHLGVMHILRLRVNRGERRHGADEHTHGMGIVTKTLQEFLGRLVQHGMVSDVGDEIFQFRRRGQLAVQHQIGNFQKAALLCQLVDGIAPITQDTLVAIDEGDGALARCGVHESRVVGH